MKNKNELLELFQVEELEKRYEMAWIDSASTTVTHGPDGTTVSGTITKNF